MVVVVFGDVGPGVVDIEAVAPGDEVLERAERDDELKLFAGGRP